MNVAIPVWDGKLSPVFDAARCILVIGVEGDAAHTRLEIYFTEESSLQTRAKKLSELGVELLICGAISRAFAELLKTFHISVIPWISGEVDEVLAAFLSGKFPCPLFVMPGHHGGAKSRDDAPGRWKNSIHRSTT